MSECRHAPCRGCMIHSPWEPAGSRRERRCAGWASCWAHSARTVSAPASHPRYLPCTRPSVHYHLIHALGLLAVAWAAGRWPGAWVTAAGWLFVAGIVLFSGSLYLVAITGPRWLGAITPVGGTCFILGWVLLGGCPRGAAGGGGHRELRPRVLGRSVDRHR